LYLVTAPELSVSIWNSLDLLAPVPSITLSIAKLESVVNLFPPASTNSKNKVASDIPVFASVCIYCIFWPCEVLFPAVSSTPVGVVETTSLFKSDINPDVDVSQYMSKADFVG